MLEERVNQTEKRLDRIEKKMRNHASKRDEQKIQCANRLDRIEKKLRKRVKEREIDLKEQFRLHDRGQTLLRRFETTTWMVNPEQYKELKEIIKELAKLVDVALGVKFP